MLTQPKERQYGVTVLRGHAKNTGRTRHLHLCASKAHKLDTPLLSIHPDTELSNLSGVHVSVVKKSMPMPTPKHLDKHAG